MFDHISLGVADLGRSAALYDAALAALGHVRLTENARHVAWGPPGFTGEPPLAILAVTPGVAEPRRGFHLALAAADRAAVDRFHAAAVAAGATDDGPPGIRYNNPNYYAAYIIDLDGHRLEAVHHGG